MRREKERVRSERRERKRLIRLRKERDRKSALSGNIKAAFFFSTPQILLLHNTPNALSHYYSTFIFYSSFHFPKSNSKCFKFLLELYENRFNVCLYFSKAFQKYFNS